MKQKDIALIIIVVFVSGVASFFLSTYLFKTSNLKENVETVSSIDAVFPEPDTQFFNDESINPTIRIKIGETENEKPFN